MPIKLLYDLARARQILSSWTSLKGLSSDQADIIVRMVAEAFAEGRRQRFEQAEAEQLTVGENQGSKSSLGAES